MGGVDVFRHGWSQRGSMIERVTSAFTSFWRQWADDAGRWQVTSHAKLPEKIEINIHGMIFSENIFWR